MYTLKNSNIIKALIEINMEQIQSDSNINKTITVSQR